MACETMSLESVPSRSAFRGFDYIEIFVGNVRHAAHYYQTVWGFQPVAIRGPEKSTTDHSVVMRQGNVVLVLTGATGARSPVAQYLRVHGEGVATVGFAVDDVEAAFEAAVAGGAAAVSEPTVIKDKDGQITRAEVSALKGLTHVLVGRSAYRGCFSPGFRALPYCENMTPIVEELDHVALAVEKGTLDAWVGFYQRTLGFEMVHEENVQTQQTGMRSKVVQDRSGLCKFPLVEPMVKRRKSQVKSS
jgi:4-hydroxyphenylpyruvate dioxygenase